MTEHTEQAHTRLNSGGRHRPAARRAAPRVTGFLAGSLMVAFALGALTSYLTGVLIRSERRETPRPGDENGRLRK